MTEWPLPTTLGDIWSTVYDHDCSAMVVLTSPQPSSVIDWRNEFLLLLLDFLRFSSNLEEFFYILFSYAPRQTYPQFWPDGRRSVKYGPVFTIDLISHNHYPNIKSWIFRINKKVSIECSRTKRVHCTVIYKCLAQRGK